jgi:bifunctional DNA-binding transcriptional regulator/antitoxin component of YhaV-PrlF toxin-antitoxin module
MLLRVFPKERVVGFTKLDNKRRLRVPREAADLLHLNPGDDVAWTVYEDKLVIQKAEDPFAAARGIDWDRVARAVDREFAEHPERFRTFEQVLEEFGVTQSDLDALPPEPGIDN